MTRKRRVWIVNPYGPLPTDGWRSTRTVLLARTLVEHGFEVTWFRNAFDHVSKRASAAPTEVFGFRVRSLPSCAYTRNVSIRRLLSEALFALRLLRESRGEPSAPDVIIAGHATLFAGLAAVVLARLHGVPLVIDMFDLWPEAFRLVLPARLRPLARVVFAPLYAVRRLVFGRAAAIIALARVNLDVARAVAPHVSAERCVLVYEGIDDAALPGEVTAAERPASDKLRVVYAGTLGQGYDVDGIVAAAAILGERKVPVRIVVAGDGPRRAKVETAAASCTNSNLVYAGRVSVADLGRLYRDADVGLCAYVPGSTVAMPCKVYDYLAAGLAVVSSLDGELAELLREQRIGLRYRAGSAAALADAIEQLASDRRLLGTLRANARKAAGQFERRVQYAKVARLLDGLVPTVETEVRWPDGRLVTA